MANLLPTIHLLAPVRLVWGLLIPARLVVLDMVDFIFYGVGGCEITTYYFLLGWLPSVSGCTPFKLAAAGRGPSALIISLLSGEDIMLFFVEPTF